MEHFYQNIEGWMDINKVDPLWSYMIDDYSKTKLNIAEIGVFKGRGTALINVFLINKNVEYDYYAIDHFKGSLDFFQTLPNEHREGIDYYPIAYNNLKTFLENNNNVKLIKNESIEESKNYSNGFFDIVYLDGSHDYDSVKKDISAWIPKIKLGGFICGDDYSVGWPGVKNCVDEFFGERVLVKGESQWVVKL